MVLFLTLIILVAVCGGFTKTLPLKFIMTLPKDIEQEIFENDLETSDINEIYRGYYSISGEQDEELNVISKIQEIDLNKRDYSQFYNIDGNAYYLVKTLRHRNKRYTSYLTLCPFKICNMGRKRMRTRRYVKTITSTDNNEGS